MRPGPVLAGILLLGAASPLPGQDASLPGDTLDAVETALDAGRVERARALLEAWRSAGAERTRRERGRARFFRARLAADADSAEALYLELAMEGDVRYGDRAWLRLAQLHLARGEAGRARAELERLRTDYPGSPLVGQSWYWTGLAASTAGDREEACRAWRRASGAGGEAAELAGDALPSCEPGGGEMPVAGPLHGEAGREPAGDGGRGPGARGRFAAQLGAFRERAGARTLAERARGAGFEVRVEGPSPADGLFRVRSVPVADRSAADALVRRLRGEGLPGVVVELEGPDGEEER